MEVPQVLAQSTLSIDKILRFSFNGLMDFKKPSREPLETVAYWEPVIAEAKQIYEQRKAAAAALPSTITAIWSGEDKCAALEAARAAGRARKATEDAAFSQMMHCHSLHDSYSYELAHSLWYNRQAAQRSIGDRVREEYRKTYEAEWAAQHVFENQQVENAIVTLKEANPHLTEDTLSKIGRRLRCRLHLLFRHAPRSAAPRRVMRGAPLVLCGVLPSKARLVYPSGHSDMIDRAF